MTTRTVCISTALVTLLLSYSSAHAVVFDVIVQDQIEYRTSNTSVGQSTGAWGWIVATDEAITLADLQSAVFTGTVSDPQITSVTQSFVQPHNWAPILPGEAAGSIFVAGSFEDLLEPGEARKTPAGGNDNLSFFSLGFGFPSSPAYTGSTFDFEGTLTMGGHQVSYASTVTISRAAGSSSPRYGPPRRISSAVPEPTALSLAVLALACCFPAIRKWRRP